MIDIGWIIEILLPTVLNGVVFGVSMGLVALGLTVIFGLMKIVNMAHGELFMLGGFAGYFTLLAVGNYWVGLAVAAVVIAILGIAMEYVSLRPLYGRGPLYGLVLTFGLALFFREFARTFFLGGAVVAVPEPISGTYQFLGLFAYPIYRSIILVIGILVYIALWFFFMKTRFGAVIRAASDDSEMLGCLGVNVRTVLTLTFGFGAFLAAVAGVLMVPIYSLFPDVGTYVILWVFIIVIVGGIGSIGGSVISALIIGQAYCLGTIWLEPREIEILIFLVMICVLIVRPRGLFGKPGMLE